jgi:hypothetical protein
MEFEYHMVFKCLYPDISQVRLKFKVALVLRWGGVPGY